MINWKRLPWRRLAMALCVALVLVLATERHSDAEKQMYVIVEGSTDAVLLDSERRWARSLGGLRLDQVVTVLDESQIEEERRLIRVRTVIDGQTVEGWVRRSILSDDISAAAEADAEVAGAQAAGQAARGLNQEIESDLEKNDERFAAALENVTALEHLRNRELGGHPEDPSPAKIRESYERFGRDGQLIR
jgi:hypothetical protein